jgi:exopolyphosphatase/pppGpp-phosphohydrolase
MSAVAAPNSSSAAGWRRLHTESVQAGCIASTAALFPGGKLTRKRWQRARSEIGVLLQQFSEDYLRIGLAGCVRLLRHAPSRLARWCRR